MFAALIVVAVTQAILVATIGALAARRMHQESGSRALKAERFALNLFASGGVGVTALLFRRVLVWLTTDSAEAPWWLLYRSPDIPGWIAYSVCECFIFVGAILLVLGMRKRS